MFGLMVLALGLIVGAVILARGELTSPHNVVLFAVVLLSGFVWQFGRRGAGSLSPTLEAIGWIGAMISVILVFVFVGWKGGVASRN